MCSVVGEHSVGFLGLLHLIRSLFLFLMSSLDLGGFQKKRVDPRLRLLAERCLAFNERGLYVLVGDKAHEQVATFYSLLQKLQTNRKEALVTSSGVLWCYKERLSGLSSNSQKRSNQLKEKVKKGYYNPLVDDQVCHFLETGSVSYCKYKDTERILGKTFSMCVLQVKILGNFGCHVFSFSGF